MSPKIRPKRAYALNQRHVKTGFSWPSKQPVLLRKVYSFLWRVVPLATGLAHSILIIWFDQILTRRAMFRRMHGLFIAASEKRFFKKYKDHKLFIIFFKHVRKLTSFLFLAVAASLCKFGPVPATGFFCKWNRNFIMVTTLIYAWISLPVVMATMLFPFIKNVVISFLPKVQSILAERYSSG